jgi:hypothetical protein
LKGDPEYDFELSSGIDAHVFLDDGMRLKNFLLSAQETEHATEFDERSKFQSNTDTLL